MSPVAFSTWITCSIISWEPPPFLFELHCPAGIGQVFICMLHCVSILLCVIGQLMPVSQHLSDSSLMAAGRASDPMPLFCNVSWLLLKFCTTVCIYIFFCPEHIYFIWKIETFIEEDTRYKKHCTQDNDTSVPFKVGALGPHTVLPAFLPPFKTFYKTLCYNWHQLPRRIFLNLINGLKSLPFQRWL